jgi:hypothetical protein
LCILTMSFRKMTDYISTQKSLQNYFIIVFLAVFLLVCPIGRYMGLVANAQLGDVGAGSRPKAQNIPVKLGLASKYPGDRHLEKDPCVVFTENFEAGSLTEIFSRWESVKSKKQMSLCPDVPSSSTGKNSLCITHIGGKGVGGHLYRRLLPGYEKLYLRFYVRFSRDCAPIHHFVHFGGYNPSTRWPQGGAGERPVGHERFTTGIEPFGRAWRWDFYSYWMEMRACPTGSCWGNDFINDKNLKVPRDKWICVELMMKMNDPVGAHNGEQALWIEGRPWIRDGQLVSHLKKGLPKGKWVWDSFLPDPDGKPFDGFRWRKDKNLNLNFLWMLLYITKAPQGHQSQVFFDDIVVAKRYIGPIYHSNK